MAKVIGLGGLFFKSADPQALAAWYKAHLGLPVEDWGGAAFAHTGLPGNSYHVWSPFAHSSDYFAPSGKDFMFNFIVDDLTQALQQVADAGAEIVGTSEDSEFGRFGWFMDPDGNKVELWQVPDGEDN
ncbi:VOC family protein [Shewanella sp. AS16]|uniref:VOC family protein n=1 Tax=Shewanella sp. AS16 TaxID=2907625 RepID=UPI001F445BFA|nr:VOC family protein [Shewanella sp. AS16]MCE9686815.1 VOC family protein [Shewanella sp. AS16]